MKTWQMVVSALLGAATLIGIGYGGIVGADGRYQLIQLAQADKEKIELLVAQTAAQLQQQTATVQAGVNANQLQLMRWELDDINARIGTANEKPGDKSRKLVLEERIKKLAGK